MSYQERKTIVSIISGVLVIAAYCIYTFGRYQAGAVEANDLKFWAGTILTFVGIGIAVSIIIQIVFHILMSIAIAVTKKMRDEQCDDKEIEKSIGAEMVEDEMDKLIELKSMRVSFVFVGAGFIAGLVALLLGYSAAVMLNILFLSFSGGGLLDGVAQLYFYRRGVTNG
jgi:hypothetical protein